MRCFFLLANCPLCSEGQWTLSHTWLQTFFNQEVYTMLLSRLQDISLAAQISWSRLLLHTVLFALESETFLTIFFLNHTGFTFLKERYSIESKNYEIKWFTCVTSCDCSTNQRVSFFAELTLNYILACYGNNIASDKCTWRPYKILKGLG